MQLSLIKRLNTIRMGTASLKKHNKLYLNK